MFVPSVGRSLVCLVFCMLNTQSGMARDQSGLGSMAVSDQKILITFTKSGGFAAPATDVHGQVTISQSQGQVQSTDRAYQPDGSYQRNLTATEIEQLSALRLREASQRLAGPTGPDQFVYDVQARLADGTSIRVQFGDMSADPVARWFIGEADRIWQARLQRK